MTLPLARKAAAALALAGVLAACSPEAAPAEEASDADIAAPAESLAEPLPKTEDAPPPTSLCANGELAIFSCPVAGGDIASVCVTQDGQGTDFAQYRFGTAPDAVDLAWPKSAGQGQLAWASVAYSGGGEAQISFARGDIRYVVYSRIVRTNFTAGEPNNPEITDGVLVLDHGEPVAHKRCTGEALVPVQYDAAQDHLAEADTLFAEIP